VQLLPADGLAMSFIALTHSAARGKKID